MHSCVADTKKRTEVQHMIAETESDQTAMHPYSKGGLAAHNLAAYRLHLHRITAKVIT